jgi:hypothetical protein
MIRNAITIMQNGIHWNLFQEILQQDTGKGSIYILETFLIVQTTPDK